MKCPHCGNDSSRVTESRAADDGLLRRRLCRGCGKVFTTMERICVYGGRNVGYLEPVQKPVLTVVEAPEPAMAPKQRAARFMPSEAPATICAAAQPLLLQWWREARWSKHRGGATWTEAAWRASCDRVAKLTPAQQIELCRGGVEYGWQALKAEYVGKSQAGAQPVSAGPPMPRDPAMLAALDQWPSTAS